MREIGGYIELDTYQGTEYYTDAIALNSGRNCLTYLIEAREYKKIYLPKFLCDSVMQACIRSKVEFQYYTIDENFRPLFQGELLPDEAIYIVNYYGLISNEEILSFRKKWKNIIIDNAQAFFQKPVEEVDTLYTCRKYFGVPDGAYLVTDSRISRTLEQDVSYDRMHFLLGRYEGTASEFYSEYSANNRHFQDEPVKLMSKLTHNLLRAIDYGTVVRARNENYLVLNNELSHINKLEVISPNGPFMYPLLIDNGAEIRRQLQKEKIYIPTLWPDVFINEKEDSIESVYAKDILPLPCDQRYSLDDMKYLIKEIKKCIS